MNIWQKTKSLFRGNTAPDVAARSEGGEDFGVDPFEIGFDGPGSMLSDHSNPKQWLEKYGKSSTLQMVVRRVACDVALTKWHLYRRLPGEAGPQGPPKQEIFDHPLLKLWKRPNSIHVGFQFRYLVQLYLELQGEAHILIKRKPGTLEPVELYPIPRNWVSQYPTEKAPYWRLNLGDGWSKEPIPPGEVIWLHDADPLEPYIRGLGVAKSLDDEVSQDEWMNKFNNQFFREGGHPGQAFALEGIDEQQAVKIQQRYQQKHTGIWNAFKALFLGVPRGGKVTVHQMGPSHRDMDFVKGKTAKRDSILQAFSMQRFEVGINEDVNRASAQASADGKARNVTLQRVVYLEEAFGEFLVPLYKDPLLMFCCENPVKETEEFRLAKASEGLARGALTIDEWRMANGWDRLPNGQGEVRMPPLNVGSEPTGAKSRALAQLRIIDPDAAELLERTWSN